MAAQANIENTLFPRVKNLIVSLLQNHIRNESLRTHLIAKVNDIHFAGTDCSNGTEGLGVHSLLVPNAFYNPTANSFQFCNGFLLQGSSVFQIVQTIAHELGHSFDPCQITRDTEDFRFHYSEPDNVEASEREFPFTGLITCLRSAESVRAIRLNREDEAAPTDPSEPGRRKGAHPKNGEGVFKKGAETARPSQDRSPFCTNQDQIGESFADRIAAEVLPTYIAQYHNDLTQEQRQLGYANVFRGGCDNTRRPPAAALFDEHPPDRARVNRLLLAHPTIRRQMGCAPSSAGLRNCDLTERRGEP